MASSPRHPETPTAWQLTLGVISLSFTLSLVSGLALVAFSSNLSGQSTGVDVQQLNYLALIGLALGLATIPSILYSIRRLAHRSQSSQNNRRALLAASIALLLLIPLIWLTSLESFNPIPVGFKALASLLFVGLPVWWLVEIGRSGLPRLSGQKQWGLVNFGIYISLPVILILEIVFLLIGVFILSAWFMQQPAYSSLFNQLKNVVLLNPQQMQLIVGQFEPLLQTPEVITAVLLTFALVIPMVEELLKPLALWFFIKRKWTPTEGFIAGMICGGVFAIVESLTALAAATSANWLALSGARVGTGLLHIVTAGLSGWALSSSWSDGKYIRIGLVYLAVVFLHGAWNLFALLVGVSPLLDPVKFSTIISVGRFAPWIMVGLVVLLALILLTMNLRLKRQTAFSSVPPQLPLQLPD